MGTATLSEPQVLAHAKRRLIPDGEAPNAYAVVDTQFTTRSWRADRSIPESVHDELAPFNHVRIGTGYPDLVGVRQLEDELLAHPMTPTEPPLFVVEAKGFTAESSPAVDRGVVQAHDRLLEANAAFVAAPAEAIGVPARSLARELNVGVLAVEADGTVEPLEVARVVGGRTGGAGAAIRFQATAQGVADQSFGLNHPKNYLAYPLAVHASGPTEALIEAHVVAAVDGARKGAAFLDLIDVTPDGVALTPLGEEVVRFAITRSGSVTEALTAFEAWQRSRKRFAEVAPEWGQCARRVLWHYPATPILVGHLQALHRQGTTAPSLVELVTALHRERPSFAVELFIRGTDSVRERVLGPDGELDREALTDGAVYHAPTVYQLKAMYYHAGILADRGAEPDRLDPTADTWCLREPLSGACR